MLYGFGNWKTNERKTVTCLHQQNLPIQPRVRVRFIFHGLSEIAVNVVLRCAVLYCAVLCRGVPWWCGVLPPCSRLPRSDDYSSRTKRTTNNQVAVLIAQADNEGAVKALNGYLSEFAADGEAWLQLAKLHIVALNYEVREGKGSNERLLARLAFSFRWCCCGGCCCCWWWC